MNAHTTLNGAVGKEKAQSSAPPVATFIADLAIKSGSTELPDGIVHIYRERSHVADNNNNPSTSPNTESNTHKAQSYSTDTTEHVEIAEHGCTIVAVLAVPPWMNPSDFLAFVAPAAEGMAHLRLIRDASPNRTMVVIQFREPASAAEFIEEFNGRPFNSIEPEICNCVRVKSIRIDVDDPVSLAVTRSSANPSAMYELPTCPVCLDRMDATVTGLVTVPCSHTFHCMCLSKWGDSRCPVCRYSQHALSSNSKSTPSTSLSYPPLPTNNLTTCNDCASRLNLWICLICGNIGCGRQGRAHAKAHFELTSHLYALELETQRVWDYAGDNYVHRLIQNKADGKLVELPSASGLEDEPQRARRQGQGPMEDDNLKAEKVELMAMQYSQILQRALDDQRAAYEEQLDDVRKRLEDTQRKTELLAGDMQRQMRETTEEWERVRTEERETRERLEKDKVKAERKAERVADVARRLEKELKEERAVSEGLMNNLAKTKARVEAVEKDKSELATKVSELEDQVRDVMFFLEANDKIVRGGGAAAEAAGGSVELPMPAPQTATKKKKKK